ncbi:MAG TPA: hypothetical protein VNO50_15830 [Pyrinomonadaceae bacterium]|nr:hypothetical protein [Pyrinomonadaceae bacterium]
MKKTKLAPSEKSEEFKRFEDFTRRILAVPKKEIDKEKARYERKKTANKHKVA